MNARSLFQRGASTARTTSKILVGPRTVVQRAAIAATARSDSLQGTARVCSNWASAPSTRHPIAPRTPPQQRPLRYYSGRMSPKDRLSQISRHFEYSGQDIPLNTPYSIDRDNQSARSSAFRGPEQKRDLSHSAISLEEEGKRAKPAAANMSSQPPHPTLLIPGPIEFDDAVLQSMSHYSEAHVGQPFVNIFGEALTMLRKVFLTTNPASQPFIISGSGTLGWDQVAANLCEPGDEALVLHTGYFADSFADCFETYGVKATQLKAPIGDRPQLPEIEKALKEKKYKVITITHTDTSTGVLSEIKPVSELVRRVSPETLIIVDGVCSVACEELRFDEWDVDCAITASQKALGTPAGLSIAMASGRAIESFKNRKTRPATYFASWKNWLPIMQNYEAKKPSYFATPSPQLVHALHTSLTQITSRSMEERFADHKKVSQQVKKAVKELGLKELATRPENGANGMTAIYLPEVSGKSLTPPEVLPSLLKKGVIFAGGLHKEIATKYIRFGHMGVSVTDPNRGDITKAVDALREALSEAGYKAPN
ncbi:hypothetical protein DOTSEDRAFT_72010 [Dothistroma septosporum NZE10]|uniref:alanine--glyoxylate transaminase n=1 Tax=Dothistroma septosporum (strain NZE10 / CBS 128990) TaxID=675120 RepID=N1PLY9_DOTSN|nr:hypothetical protein DOTSEDRAFT_72010 [Dothistroma septosporum NZE10]